MLLPEATQTMAGLCQLRRKDLRATVNRQYPDKKGPIVLFGAFENHRHTFEQESSFYYFTGITEPGAVAVIDQEGKTTLYVPHHDGQRSAWVHTPVPVTPENAKQCGMDEITFLGERVDGYQWYPYMDKKYYATLITELLHKNVDTFFVVNSAKPGASVEQRRMIDQIDSYMPGFKQKCTNISELVAHMRRKKDMREIETLYKAVEITILAHEAAAHAIEGGMLECEVQASLEYMFTGSKARPAFPSIVAGGKNGTVLHYQTNVDTLKNGQLVVIDIGAEYEHYCADLTRTYPVSGTFTKRQKELYNLVLATQEYIAALAKPGIWLSNAQKPEQSLNHLAKKYLDERGYGNYFIHGIGHFLGMDVHDVGDLSEPLKEGDVITIEPGIYIPEEGIGIRIEDNYWIVKDGNVCLSESLPKKPEDIEALMAQDDEPESSYHSFNEMDDDSEEFHMALNA